MTKNEFIEKWKYQPADGYGKATFDFSAELEKDLDAVIKANPFDAIVIPPEVREQLAEYAHNAWGGWMFYLFEKSELNNDGTVTIPKWAVDRWKRQAETHYEDLPEDEKESDREEADRMLAIIKAV